MKPRIAFLLPLTLLLAGVALIATAASADDEDEGRAHEQYFEHYEGTKTCLECHRAEAESFFYSQHYQWRGETSELTNTKDEKLGKLNTINDFCTNPRINWIGEVANAEGDVLAKGCSKCHAGSGALPEQKISEEQLLNIDCMICHTPGYRRDLYRNDAGAWEWMPILKDNREGLDYVAHGVGKTSRTTCLRCHSASGGGPNYKRGDLSYALRDCEPSHDVHMASEGHDLSCSTLRTTR